MGNNEILVAKPVRDFQQTVRSEAGLQFSRVGRSHLTLSPSPCAGPSELVRLECYPSFHKNLVLKFPIDGATFIGNSHIKLFLFGCRDSCLV